MSPSDEWSAPGRPVPPPPSGYEALPTGGAAPPPPPRGYLGQTYPAQGYPPAPEYEYPEGAALPGYGPPLGPAYGAPPGPAYGAPTGPAYGATYGPGYAPVYGQPTHTEGIAIAALVTGLVGLLTCLVFLGPVAIGLGVAGLRNIRAKGTTGRGMAITGVVTGALATAILIFIIVAIIVSAGSP